MNLLETRGPHVFGSWTVIQLVEWEGEAFPHSFFFPDIPVSAIREASPSGMNSRLSEKGMILSTTQIFVLCRGDLRVLIELGTGNGKKRPANPYWNNQNLPYMETLASLNIQPEDVDYVFLSHLHVDHVGLATTRKENSWVPTFPRAKYVLHPDEWEYWNNLPSDHPHWHPGIDDSVRPLVEADCMQWVRDGDSVASIRIHEAGGHTPGNIFFEVEGSNLWFIGDLLHHPAQVAHPEWPDAFDIDQENTVHQRKSFFKRFADSGAVVFASHLGNQFSITETDEGLIFEE